MRRNYNKLFTQKNSPTIIKRYFLVLYYINMESILIKIRNPEGTLYEDTVISVSAKNETGKFDVLPMHQDFISIIKDELNIIEKNNSTKTFKFQKAVMKIKNNRVDVFMNISDVSTLSIA